MVNHLVENYFDKGVRLYIYIEIELIMSLICNQGPSGK